MVNSLFQIFYFSVIEFTLVVFIFLMIFTVISLVYNESEQGIINLRQKQSCGTSNVNKASTYVKQITNSSEGRKR